MPVQVLDELASSVEQMDPGMVMVLSKRALDADIDPADIVENGIAKGLRRVGERLEKGEAFLTDLVGAAAAAKEALESVLRPAMTKARTSQRSLGKVVLGTVSGDIHDIGKNIVAAMLFASGFEVVDLGTDVSVGDLASKSNEVGARIVGASAPRARAYRSNVRSSANSQREEYAIDTNCSIWVRGLRATCGVQQMVSEKKSEALFEKAKSVTVGGVHDELRYTEPYMFFFKRAAGSKLYDIEDRTYTDFLLGYGPLILGHCHPKVVQAVKKAAASSDLWGIGTTEMEYKLAERVTHHIPSAEKVRFCNAGSDATFHAIRLSRAFTGRKKILKFEGGYHGWHDYVDISVMPPADKVGAPFAQSAGILPEAMAQTIVIPWNDVDALEKTIAKHKDELAAVITEPILHNIGVVMPKEGFLQTIRELTERNGIVFILDEVITAFRHSLGGAQKLFGIKPDLTAFAKAMANGYPMGGLAGRADIMNRLRPLGDVHMAATYYSHPISVAASLATISELESGRVHERMDGLVDMISKGLTQLIQDFNLKAQVKHFHSIFTLYFTDAEIRNYPSVLNNDADMYRKYRHAMNDQGIILSTHHLKRCHLSAAHTKADANKFLASAKKAFEKITK